MSLPKGALVVKEDAMSRLDAHKLGQDYAQGLELTEEQDYAVRRDPTLSREFWAGYRGEGK
jgi:hypothetical protein